MNTPARRASSAAVHARRKAAGQVKATFWLRPETAKVLVELADHYGSKDAAVNLAILELGADGE